jgi:hypothetical protein
MLTGPGTPLGTMPVKYWDSTTHFPLQVTTTRRLVTTCPATKWPGPASFGKPPGLDVCLSLGMSRLVPRLTFGLERHTQSTPRSGRSASLMIHTGMWAAWGRLGRDHDSTPHGYFPGGGYLPLGIVICVNYKVRRGLAHDVGMEECKVQAPVASHPSVHPR